jgi:hypothetical protein
MPKCNCAGNSCSCLVTGGSGVSVTGQGTVASPYIVSLSPAPGEIDHAVAGDLDLTTYGTTAALRIVLDANVTDILLLGDGIAYDLVFEQGAAGGKTVAFPADILWAGGTAPVITSTAAAVDWVRLVQAGGVWVGTRLAANLS